MLDHWLSPVNTAAFSLDRLQPSQIGRSIDIHSKGQFPALQEVKIALIGIEEKEADAIRGELYPMSFPFSGLSIVDLGNIRRKSIDFVIPSLKELFDSRIFPVVIGGDPVFTLAQYKAFLARQQHISLIVVDERIRVDPSQQEPKKYYLNEILQEKQYKPFHMGFIGIQTHYTEQASFRFINQQNYDCIRLGKAKASPAEIEPVIRDGDIMSMNLACLKQAEAPGVPSATPSGFFTEEACQISRYAGMSDKLRSFGIYGFRPSLDRRNQTAQAVAQIIWYFIEGFYSRKNDYPVSTDGLVEYIVDFKKLDYQITFWKSQKSGRWWMQAPAKTSEPLLQRHRLIPCSYNDYKMACQEELPDRLLNAYKRFS